MARSSGEGIPVMDNGERREPRVISGPGIPARTSSPTATVPAPSSETKTMTKPTTTTTEEPGTARTTGTASAPAPAAPVVRHRGAYGAQRLPSNTLGFTLGRTAVRRLSIPWLAKCTTETGKGAEPALLDRILIVDALPVSHGRFEAVGMYDFPPGPAQVASVAFTLRGAIDGRAASGTLSVTGSITLGGLEVAECKTPHTIAWHARSGRPCGR